MNSPLKKIKRKDCLEKYPSFPRANYYQNKFFYPESVDSYNLSLESKSAKGHIKDLTKELLAFLKSLNINELIFLGDTSTEWLYQKNDYKPVREAYIYLESNKIGKTFNGGLIVRVSELPVFLKHLFWLGRCNAAFPLVHFLDEKQVFVASICKYGSIHLSILDIEADKLTEDFLTKSKFTQLGERGCYEQFSKSSAINGRRAII